ncbi:gcn5-related n-acetyltransferase family protein [Moniliophthora roreri]|nr:gcn5-related n-acetyltransferase family protein [Moniliophthora roreri]
MQIIIFIMAPKDSIAIRPFISADMPQLQELHSNHLCLVAHDTSLVQGPVAFVTASLRKQGDMDQHIQLLTLGVLPSHQSKGLARRLVLQVVAALNPSGGQISVHTHVCTTNTPGQHFYESLGMRLRMQDHHPVIARNVYSYSTRSRPHVQALPNHEQDLFRSRDAYFMEGRIQGY